MYTNEEEKVSIIIGDALLSLLAHNTDISAETLTVQMKQMLETETDDTRCLLIKAAISLTQGFFSGAGSAGYADYGSAEDNQSPERILL